MMHSKSAGRSAHKGIWNLRGHQLKLCMMHSTGGSTNEEDLQTAADQHLKHSVWGILQNAGIPTEVFQATDKDPDFRSHVESFTSRQFRQETGTASIHQSNEGE
jgi:hypothetical protein